MTKVVPTTASRQAHNAAVRPMHLRKTPPRRMTAAERAIKEAREIVEERKLREELGL